MSALFLLTFVGSLATAWLVALGCDLFSTSGASERVVSGFLTSFGFAVLGSLIFYYHPTHRIGWLSLGIGFWIPVVSAADLYAQCGATGTIAAPGMQYVAWFFYTYGAVAVIPLTVLLPMLFPSGQFLSPRWRWATIIMLGVLVLTATGLGLASDLRQGSPNPGYHYPLANPFAVIPLPDWWFPLFRQLNNLDWVVLRLVPIVALGVRFRRSTGDERQQIKWLVSFLAITAIVAVLFFNIPSRFFGLAMTDTIWFDLLILVSFGGIPIIIGVAIFKYRLYDIDLIINRTLVYGGLTLLVLGIYSLIVGGLSLLFQQAGSLPIALLATALIAIVFQPAREWLQRSVNRLMFGQRDEPYAVLSQMSQQLQRTAEPDETLASIVAMIARALKLPFVSIELIDQSEQIGRAAVGIPAGELVEFPLQYQQDLVGRLMVSPRAAGEQFTAKEQQLLRDIAGQTGAAASSTRLTLALQRSRERLVLAREEERRRIRRDLHDGFGPTLASQTLKFDMVLEQLEAQDIPGAARDILQLKRQTQQMVADIRRLVYELRPPALDELGLLEALRAHVAQMSDVRKGLWIVVEAAPEPLPPLPAAIEVAAYRIVLEGVTNVVRHAEARTCRVRFVVDTSESPPRLMITIADDGCGMPAHVQPGVGLASMRERAVELGGTCTVSPQGQAGTLVSAALPFHITR